MVWNPRRKNWVSRGEPVPDTARPDDLPVPSGTTSTDPPLVIPDQPVFSPPQIGLLLQVPRTTIWSWIRVGKLAARNDMSGDTYVTREELIAFCRLYLQRTTADPR